ncbi:hypothetical protein CLF_106627 [Clonorchis sinensis]|uniref:Uncharacterized protein n=1 Tax=Clonorchis sinensis TaxID=79923 RepID=G7YFF6_CLOSI|nr:hypothetical protein CLF_106627 [Clonorchis sinensis]
MGFDTTYLPIIEIPVSSSYRRPKIHAQTASYVVCFMMSWSRHRRVPEVDSHVSKQSGRKPIGTAWHNANVQPVRELPQTSSGTSNRFLEISGKMVRSQRLEQEVKTNNPGEHEKSDVQKMQIMTELIEKQRRIDKYWSRPGYTFYSGVDRHLGPEVFGFNAVARNGPVIVRDTGSVCSGMANCLNAKKRESLKNTYVNNLSKAFRFSSGNDIDDRMGRVARWTGTTCSDETIPTKLTLDPKSRGRLRGGRPFMRATNRCRDSQTAPPSDVDISATLLTNWTKAIHLKNLWSIAKHIMGINTRDIIPQIPTYAKLTIFFTAPMWLPSTVIALLCRVILVRVYSERMTQLLALSVWRTNDTEEAENDVPSVHRLWLSGRNKQRELRGYESRKTTGAYTLVIYYTELDMFFTLVMHAALRNLTWGFTKDYDYYGNYRPNHSNQSVASMEPRAVPNTTAANYGFYMDSEQAVNIRNLERGMIREIRRS